MNFPRMEMIGERQDPGTRTLRWSLILMVATAMVGPGISYGKLYAFHIVMPFVAFSIVRFILWKEISEKTRILRWPMLFIVVTMVWYSLGLIWAQDRHATIQYIAIMSISYAFVFALLILVRSKADLRIVLVTIGVVLAVECGIALMEIFTDLRWPISRYSWNTQMFGRETDLSKIWRNPNVREHIMSSPTGFHWNPNHLATFLGLAFAFVLVLLKRFWAVLAGLILLLIVVAAGARLVYMAMLLISVIMIALIPSRSLVPTVFLLCVAIVFMLGARMPWLRTPKYIEFESVARYITGWSPDVKKGPPVGEPLEEDSSVGTRRHATMICLASIPATDGLGLGGGNSRWYLAEHWDVPTLPIVDPHNWWLEVLCEGGVPYMLVYFALWAYLFISIAKRWFKEKDPWMKKVCFALMLAMLGAVPAGVAPSSMVYYFPLYCLLGLAMIVATPSSTVET